MSNWDLMMPGMGLTAIGIAGLVLSYAEIAHTFIDGMHALTGLTMFIGLIFLAAGILDGGISTSNRAKATTLVILSIALGFGMYAMTMNTSNYTVTIAGILMAIAFPAIIIAYLAMKHPTVVKPIGAIVSIASAMGIVMWISFGIFAAPDAYMIPQQAQIEEPVEDLTPAARIFAVEILADSVQEGNPDYSPDVAVVTQGDVVRWTNADAIVHTVTSTEDFGETFDSGLIDKGETFSLDTSNLEPGEYEYLCSVHAWMNASLVIEAAPEPIKVSIPQGAGFVGCEEADECYLPFEITVNAGDTVSWSNDDTVAHTVTSGIVTEGADEKFDSGLFNVDAAFEVTFNDSGTFDYFCQYHPWMTGIVNVE